MIKRVKVLSGLLLMAVMVTWLLGTQMRADTATPGTVNDPIVTKSYVDKKVGELQKTLTEMMGKLGSTTDGTAQPTTQAPETTTPTEGGVSLSEVVTLIDAKIAAIDNNGAGQASLFQVVEATNGQRLICGASAEVILRAGSAQVIAGINGDGLADLTAGEDLAGDAKVPKQHHLLVSRDDGRGLLITSEDTSYILVKGAYTLK